MTERPPDDTSGPTWLERGVRGQGGLDAVVEALKEGGERRHVSERSVDDVVATVRERPEEGRTEARVAGGGAGVDEAVDALQSPPEDSDAPGGGPAVVVSDQSVDDVFATLERQARKEAEQRSSRRTSRTESGSRPSVDARGETGHGGLVAGTTAAGPGVEPFGEDLFEAQGGEVNTVEEDGFVLSGGGPEKVVSEESVDDVFATFEEDSPEDVIVGGEDPERQAKTDAAVEDLFGSLDEDVPAEVDESNDTPATAAGEASGTPDLDAGAVADTDADSNEASPDIQVEDALAWAREAGGSSFVANDTSENEGETGTGTREVDDQFESVVADADPDGVLAEDDGRIGVVETDEDRNGNDPFEGVRVRETESEPQFGGEGERRAEDGDRADAFEFRDVSTPDDRSNPVDASDIRLTENDGTFGAGFEPEGMPSEDTEEDHPEGSTPEERRTRVTGDGTDVDGNGNGNETPEQTDDDGNLTAEDGDDPDLDRVESLRNVAEEVSAAETRTEVAGVGTGDETDEGTETTDDVTDGDGGSDQGDDGDFEFDTDIVGGGPNVEVVSDDAGAEADTDTGLGPDGPKADVDTRTEVDDRRPSSASTQTRTQVPTSSSTPTSASASEGSAGTEPAPETTASSVEEGDGPNDDRDGGFLTRFRSFLAALFGGN
jgi:hypothetical protein